MRVPALVLAAALAATAACGSSPAPGDGAAATSAPPVTQPVNRDPTDAEVRAASETYLRAVKAEIVSITVKDHHVGVYVRGTPEWTLDQFVEHLPTAAEAAREMLLQWPTVSDVDICGDGPWVPRGEYDDFASASRVQVFRDRLGRMPPSFATPADVLRAGGAARSIDYYLDARIVRESRAYRDAARASSGKRSPGPL